MGLLSPYLNLAGAAQVKVKTVLEHPAERGGGGRRRHQNG